MINSEFPNVTIDNNYLAAVLHERLKIKAMAVQLVAGQVEAHLDMISAAGQEEYSTFQDVAACVAGANETAADYVEDLLAEFRVQLLAEMKKVKIVTKAVLLKPAGEIDADVDVTIGE